MQTSETTNLPRVVEITARLALILGLVAILWAPYEVYVGGSATTLLGEVRWGWGMDSPLASIWGSSPTSIGWALLFIGQFTSLALGPFRLRRWGGSLLTAVGALLAVGVLLMAWTPARNAGCRFPLGAGWWLTAIVGILAVGFDAWIARTRRTRIFFLVAIALILAAASGAWAWKQLVHTASCSVIDNIDLSHEPYSVVIRGQHGSRPLTDSNFKQVSDGPDIATANDLNGDSLHLDLTWERWGEVVKRTISAPLKADVYTTFEFSRTCQQYWPMYGPSRVDTLAEFSRGYDTTLVCTYLVPQSLRMVWKPTTAQDSFFAVNHVPVDTTVVPMEGK